jgi:hypothetical protein
VTSSIPASTSSSLNIANPIRSTPSSLIQEQLSTSTSQRGGSSTFSPWGPQMSYRGEPRVSTSTSSCTVSSRSSDLTKPDTISSDLPLNLSLKR